MKRNFKNKKNLKLINENYLLIYIIHLHFIVSITILYPIENHSLNLE
jgi:hypothetical protein